MLAQNYMGLYMPGQGAGTPTRSPVSLDPSFAMGPNLYSGQPNVRLLPQQQTLQTPQPQQPDPWTLMQPKLDAYLKNWWAQQYASLLGGDQGRQERGGGFERAGSGRDFNGAGAGANRDPTFEGGSAGSG